MGVVCQGWGSGMHASGLHGGQATHCNVAIVGFMPVAWPGVCVSETRFWGAVSVGWVVLVAVLLGCFR